MMSVSQHSPTGMPTASAQVFYPLQTIRCVGAAVFRNQFARDVACLLDVDDDVVSWSCQPVAISIEGKDYRPDFLVQRHLGDVIIDVTPPTSLLDKAAAIVVKTGYRYEVADRKWLSSGRLKNAKDLLRYGGYETPLSDRIRLLAALEDNGSLTVAECLPAFQDIRPIAGLASLVLHRFVTMDLDEIIGPETQVTRFRS